MRKKTEPTISFLSDPEWHGALIEPVPSGKVLPDWYKKISAYVPHPTELPGETIKACMPVLDAYQAGYMMLTSAPVRFVVNEDQIDSAWRSDDMPMISNHSADQITGSNWKGPVLKWLNPWVIKTAPGYSCLITHPVNRPELPFFTLTAVVDTDLYPNQINFPFLWTGERPYDDILPAGTPMAQVIPFRREDITMTVRPMDSAEQAERSDALRKMSLRNHNYRDSWRRLKRWRSLDV